MNGEWTSDEMMTIEAARRLGNGQVCFVGIGLPSAAANLALRTSGPDTALIYESGTIATRPEILPLSIGDPELCERALTTVSVPEMFRYWLQGGRIDVGFLGAAEIDKFGNINTTVIGNYQTPSVRLPGAGGASEIAGSCHQVFVVMRQSRRTFVDKVGFVTSFGHGRGGDARRSAGLTTRGPTLLVTDLCVMEPEAGTHELIVTALHPGVTRDDVQASTGWDVRFAAELGTCAPPSAAELGALRDLQKRTSAAHASARAS